MSGPAERMPGEERDLAGPRAIPAGHLADIGAKFAEVRAAVVELHAAQARELDRVFGMLAALRNSVLALELAAGDDRSTEIRSLLDELTMMRLERDRQGKEISALRGNVKGLSRRLAKRSGNTDA